MSKTYDVCILGAAGPVGEAMLEILEERGFPLRRLYPLGLSDTAGDLVQFQGSEIPVIDVAGFDFSQAQVCLFCAGASVSALYAPRAAAAGCVVIDNTARFRLETDVPLVVPEVNGHVIGQYRNRGVIASPNPSAVQTAVALKPIYDAVGIRRVNVATYQAVSGTGKHAVDELAEQTRALFNMREVEAEVYPKRIAFNVLPHVDVFEDNGYTREEMKLVWETRKILEDPDLLVNATTVQVPVFYGNSEALHIETRSKISARAARELLENAPSIQVIDEPVPGGYPTPATDAAGSDAVFVGRIREDISHPLGLDLWVVSDNLRKGTALNCIQIAEILIDRYLD